MNTEKKLFPGAVPQSPAGRIYGESGDRGRLLAGGVGGPAALPHPGNRYRQGHRRVFEPDGGSALFTPEQPTEVYRCIQETLENVIQK